MSDNKVLTVSVAAYNVGSYLDQCLKPFTHNDVLNRVEVLVIDDGSSDNTASIATGYQNKYPDTFKVIRKPNGGWGSTVNTALELATGKYFKQLDGDDYYNSSFIPQFIDELEIATDDLILTPYITFISETGEITSRNNPTEDKNLLINKSYSIAEFGKNSHIAMHHCAFRTDILKNNGVELLGHAFYTDVELVVKALYYSHTVKMLPFVVYCYRTMREGQSSSNDGFKKHYKDHENVILRIASFLESKPENEGYLIGKKRLMSMVRFHYNLYYHLKPSLKHQSEFRRFDLIMQGKYSQFGIKNTKSISMLRKTRYVLYIPMCMKYRKSELSY